MEKRDEAHNTVATASCDRKGVFYGSLRGVCPCRSGGYCPDEDKVCTISVFTGKASQSATQEAIFTQPEGGREIDGGAKEGNLPVTWAAFVNIYLYNNPSGNI
jgi:hypothetical protein